MKKRKKLNKINENNIKESKYFIPTLEKEYDNIINNSWFDVKYQNYNIVDNKSINIDLEEPNNNIMRAKQIKISTTQFQKNIILSWIEQSRIIYNITVKYLRKNKLVSFIKLRKIIKDSFNKDYNIPVHIIDNSIKDVLKAYKSSIALLKAGEIKYFRIRYKKFKKDKQTIVIEQQDFSKKYNGFYTNKLKENGKFSEFKTIQSIKRENINHDTRLTYNKLNKKLFLSIPTNREVKIISTNNICAIDPGSKTFLTSYNPNGQIYKLGNNNIKLSKIIERREYLKKKIKSITKYKKYERRINRKLSNLVKELHYKCADFLCKKNDIILLGKLSTKGITSKLQKLAPKEKRLQYQLSHDKFRSILKNKGEEYNKRVYIVDESYTSKTCGGCGIIQEIKGSRVYKCQSCKVDIGRDINGARNILIKNQILIRAY